MKETDNLVPEPLDNPACETASVKAETDMECQKIKETYKKQAEEQYWKLVAAGKRAADTRAGRMASLAAMEAKKKVLAFKQEMMQQAFDEALDRLVNLPEEAYVNLLASFAAKAAKTGRELLIFSPTDRAFCGKRVTLAANNMLLAQGGEAALTMAEETRDIKGGVIVTDGQVDVNCSIEALISAQRDALVLPVSKILFD